MTRIIIFILGLVLGMQLHAQDQDFSQYYSLPTFLNPALTGSFNGTYRVGIIYQDQWRGTSTVPVNTMAFNGEYKRRLESVNSKFPDYFAGGVKFFTDRTSLIEHNTNSVALAFAFHKSLSNQKHNYLSAGFDIGIVQKNINYDYLNFADEFNLVNDFTLSTAELLESNNFAYADYSMGLNYSTHFNKKNQLHTGFTLKHLSTPNVSFWRDSENTDPDLVKVNKLPLLFGFQLASQNRLSYKLTLTPRLILQSQGPHNQLFAGSSIRFDLGTYNDAAFHFGLFGRVTQTEDTYAFATVTTLIGFEVSDMNLGISYDMYLGDIARKYQGIGVFEVSITYTGETLEDTAVCPEF